MNDMDYNLSQNFGLRKRDMKEECSSDFPNCYNDEGSPALDLFLVLYCVDLDAFTYWFDFLITGSNASEPVHDIEDVIDLKVEPLEVSYCIFWACVRWE